MCVSYLSAVVYPQPAPMVNTSDTMLQKAAVGMREEIGLHQLSLIPSSPGPHNTVLKPFVSFETLNRPVSSVSANRVTLRESLPWVAWSQLPLMPGALFILGARVTVFSNFSTEVELQQQEFCGSLWETFGATAKSTQTKHPAAR